MALHEGDVGAIIRLTSTTDISSASALKIRFIRPDGVRGEWTGTLNGTTNVQYTTTSKADIPKGSRGFWTFYGYAELSSGWKGHCSAGELEVLAAP